MKNSEWQGVPLGLHVPDAFGAGPVRGEEMPRRCASVGAQVVELEASVVETFLGVPVAPAVLNPPEASVETGLLPLEEEVFAEALALGRRSFALHVRAWRSAVSLAPLEAFRRSYDHAGVGIEIVRWDDLAHLADEEIDYAFRVAHALGATALSTELTDAAPERLASFADRHGLRIGFHGDDVASDVTLEWALSLSPLIGVSVDLGDWLIAGHASPLPFLERHADRITHVRLKDRRTSDGAVTWFGQGEAPIRDVLQAMRDHAWTFPAVVEIPYDLATDADQLAEIARAIGCCRSYLT